MVVPLGREMDSLKVSLPSHQENKLQSIVSGGNVFKSILFMTPATFLMSVAIALTFHDVIFPLFFLIGLLSLFDLADLLWKRPPTQAKKVK